MGFVNSLLTNPAPKNKMAGNKSKRLMCRLMRHLFPPNAPAKLRRAGAIVHPPRASRAPAA